MTDEFVILRKVTSPGIFGQKNAAVFFGVDRKQKLFIFRDKKSAISFGRCRRWCIGQLFSRSNLAKSWFDEFEAQLEKFGQILL